MRAKRNDAFARKIVTFKEGRYRHRNGGPPVGVADNNRVVIGHVGDLRFKLRSRIGSLIALGFIQAGAVIRAVGFDKFQFSQIRAGFLLDLLRDKARIARPGVKHNQGLAFWGSLGQKGTGGEC